MNGLTMLGLWAATAAGIAIIVQWACVVIWTNANSGLSSWVQAIGSVAAIGLGMWVVQRTHRLEQQREAASAAAERLSLYHSALQLIGAVYQLGRKAKEHANEHRGDLRHLSIELEGLAGAFARIDHLRFDDYRMIEALLVTESTVKTLLVHMREAYENVGGMYTDPWPDVRDWGDQAMATVKPRMDALYAEIVAQERASKR